MVTALQPTTTASQEDPGQPGAVFDHVSIGFEGKQVLENISLTVSPGETRILLGPAGSGKSVLLKLANGLIRPDTGTITVFGERIDNMPEEQLFQLRGRIGMVFQEGALFDSLTVRDNVAYRLMEQKIPEAEVTERVREALRFVQLEQTLEKFPSQLSGGMRRRVAIARAIINRPDLILYDSPTGGLDPITSTSIIELVMKLRDVYRTSSLLVSHRLQDGFVLASHYYDPSTNHMHPVDGKPMTDVHTSFMVLHDGKVIFDGTAQQLATVRDPYIREYIS